MQHYYEDLDWPFQVQWLSLAEETRGAAETVAMGIQAIRGRCIDQPDQEERPLLILDGDAFYRVDVIGIFRNLEVPAVAVFSVNPEEPPIFPYSLLDNESRNCHG